MARALGVEPQAVALVLRELQRPERRPGIALAQGADRVLGPVGIVLVEGVDLVELRLATSVRWKSEPVLGLRRSREAALAVAPGHAPRGSAAAWPPAAARRRSSRRGRARRARPCSSGSAAARPARSSRIRTAARARLAPLERGRGAGGSARRGPRRAPRERASSAGSFARTRVGQGDGLVRAAMELGVEGAALGALLDLPAEGQRLEVGAHGIVRATRREAPRGARGRCRWSRRREGRAPRGTSASAGDAAERRGQDAAPRRSRPEVGPQAVALRPPGEAERHEAIEELLVGDPRRLPELREHADRREARDGVDLVHEDAARRPLEEEVHARVPARVHRAEGPDGELPEARRRRARPTGAGIRSSVRLSAEYFES